MDAPNFTSILIYGKPIETDHKPLEYLFRKLLTAAPPRLQRMMLTLQKYDLHVVYKPGKSLHIADALSRAPVTLSAPDVDDHYQVHTVQHLPVSAQRLEQFYAETTADSVLQKLQYTAHVGWTSRLWILTFANIGAFGTKSAPRTDSCYEEND